MICPCVRHDRKIAKSSNCWKVNATLLQQPALRVATSITHCAMNIAHLSNRVESNSFPYFFYDKFFNYIAVYIFKNNT